MTEIIFVENIKCGGCATSIKNAMMRIEGITEVEVDVESEKISLQGEINRPEVLSALSKLGYPEKGLNHLGHQARSFVSCAVGKFST